MPQGGILCEPLAERESSLSSLFGFIVTLFEFFVLVLRGAFRVHCKSPSRRFLNHNFGYVFGFGEGEFLTDLGLALVDGLETLTSEHVDLLG